jgi:DNA topoisomerase-3
MQTRHPQWGNYATALLEAGIQQPRKGKKNDKAHPPIHPTQLAEGLNDREAQLYEFITRRYLACCSQDAKGNQTKVSFDIAGEVFTSSGLVITQRNYLDIYTYDVWKNTSLPSFTLNEVVTPTKIDLTKGDTQPPAFLTEVDLIALMDEHGIGTDATIHEHIKKIIDREYVVLQAKHFIPTNLGISLIQGYDQIGFDKSLSKPLLRREMEQDLVRICEGTLTKQAMLYRNMEQYRDVVTKTIRESRLLEHVHPLLCIDM